MKFLNEIWTPRIFPTIGNLIQWASSSMYTLGPLKSVLISEVFSFQRVNITCLHEVKTSVLIR